MMQILFYIFILVCVYYVLFGNLKFILIPIFLVNIFSDSLTLISEGYILPPSYLRLLVIFGGVFRFRKMLFSNFYGIWTLIITIIFFSIGLINSSNIPKSVEGTIKLFLPFLFFPIGIYLQKKHENIQSYEKVLTLSFLYIFVCLIIFQIFKIGESPYIPDFFYLGGFNIQITYFMAYTNIFLLYLAYYRLNVSLKNYWIYILVFTSLIFCVLIFRRVAIISTLIGLFFFVFSRLKNLKLLIFVFFVFLAVVPILDDGFQGFYDLLEKRQKNSIEDEGRFKEFQSISQDLKVGSYLPNLTVGKELFNSEEHFAKNTHVVLKQQINLHTDIGTIFHGSGFLGLISYFSLLILIFSRYLKSINLKLFFFPTIPFIFSFILISVSGQYYSMTSLTVFWIYLGFMTIKNEQNFIYK